MKRLLFVTLTMLCVLQLSAQEDKYKFEIKPLVNREFIVHARSNSWNPLDHSDNKNSFEFEVPVNTVAIVYAYRSVLSEVPVPGLRLLSGLTKCVGGAASFVNPNVSAGLNMISEGLYDLSIPSGTGDVDIYLFTKKEAIYEFRETSTSDCQKFYDPKYDLLSQKSGTKTINFKNPVEESFYIYLGLLNKNTTDAITVRIEAVAITAVRGAVGTSKRETTRVEVYQPAATSSSQEFARHQVIKNETFITINGIKMYIHKMRPGETIEAIAKAYNTTVQIISINNQDLKGKFSEGVMLKIPASADIVTDDRAQEYAYHQVEKYQSLYDIARRYGVNEDDIIRYNPKAKNGINTGEILMIPVGNVNNTDRQKLDFAYHTVKQNESVISICSLYRVNIDDFYKYNPKSKTSLKEGDVVVLPKGESFYNGH